MSITDTEPPSYDGQALPSQTTSPPEIAAPKETPPKASIAEIASDIENTSLADTPPQEMPKIKINLCGVCNEKEAKYKCSRCYLPYCSVSCSAVHKSTHPVVDEPRPAAPLPPPAPAERSGAPRAGTVAAVGYQGPFAVLDESKELRRLFAQFPNLPAQLDAIHTATLPPVVDDFGRQQQRHGKQQKQQQSWNQDRGLQLGVEALKKARHTYGKDGEGVREYGRLVLQLLERDSEGAAKEIIQRHLDDESTQIIRQLLEMER